MAEVSPILGLEHLHVYCSDLETSERWFRENLGAELVARRQLNGVAASELQLGGIRLVLGGNRPEDGLVAPRPRPFGWDHIGLKVQDLDACAAALKRRGVVFEREPHQARPGLRIAFVTGPDDLRIELLERRD